MKITLETTEEIAVATYAAKKRNADNPDSLPWTAEEWVINAAKQEITVTKAAMISADLLRARDRFERATPEQQAKALANLPE